MNTHTHLTFLNIHDMTNEITSVLIRGFVLLALALCSCSVSVTILALLLRISGMSASSDKTRQLQSLLTIYSIPPPPSLVLSLPL